MFVLVSSSVTVGVFPSFFFISGQRSSYIRSSGTTVVCRAKQERFLAGKRALLLRVS